MQESQLRHGVRERDERATGASLERVIEKSARSANRGVNQLEKGRRNLFDDVHFAVLKNRLVIELDDAFLDDT